MEKKVLIDIKMHGVDAFFMKRLMMVIIGDEILGKQLWYLPFKFLNLDCFFTFLVRGVLFCNSEFRYCILDDMIDLLFTEGVSSLKNRTRCCKTILYEVLSSPAVSNRYKAKVIKTFLDNMEV